MAAMNQSAFAAGRVDPAQVLTAALADFQYIELAVLFGSTARGQERPDSDVDVAVAARHALTIEQKMALIEALAARIGRPIDLVDLTTVAEPLLDQILRHGRRLLGSDDAFGRLISRHLFDQADFMPYRDRVLAERRASWIGQ
jgi:predicted nucleotidyltransferase